MGSVNPSIDLAHDGDIAVITIDNPPVNALKHEVRAGLIEAFAAGRGTTPGSRRSVLACAGRTFSAGADIKEFGKPPRRRADRGDRRRSRQIAKPVVAAIARHARSAAGSSWRSAAIPRRGAEARRVGLPEVKLGLLPGAGGTQRLPRLIGAGTALAMIVSGNPIARRGAVRRTASSTRSSTATSSTRRSPSPAASSPSTAPLAPRARPRRPARRRAADPSGFDAAAATLDASARAACEAPRPASRRCATPSTCRSTRAWRASASCSWSSSTSDQSQAQRHVFFAEREAAKVPDMPAGTQAAPSRKRAASSAPAPWAAASP